MPNNNTWAEILKAYINDCIDRLRDFFTADEDFEYEEIVPNDGKIDVEIRISIRAKKR